MISRTLLILAFTCVCVYTRAQVNLVKNPSFEQHLECPNDWDQMRLATGWNCIDTFYVSTLDSFQGNPYCSPDYINSCDVGGSQSCPDNPWFYHYPRTGNGMAQVWMYDNQYDTVPYYRDYLLGHLYSTLTAGKSYCVTFYVVMEHSADYAIDHIGAYLDNGSIDTNSSCGLPHTEDVPQVLDSVIINDTLRWTRIQGSFVANGTERIITIGNFSDSAHTDKIQLFPGMANFEAGSYYLVDDVSVIASDAVADAGADVTIAAGDSAYIGIDSNGEGMPCLWYVTGEVTPVDSGGRMMVHPDTTTSYVVQMDLCGNVTYDTVVVHVGAVGVKSLATKGEPGMWPNPATTELTVSNWAGRKVVLYDMMGREVCSAAIVTDQQTVSIAKLAKGVYNARFSDRESGVVIVKKVVKE